MEAADADEEDERGDLQRDQRHVRPAFIGFNSVSVIAEEVRDPERVVPRAVLLSFLVCTLLYVGVSMVAVGLVDWTALGTSSVEERDTARVGGRDRVTIGAVVVIAGGSLDRLASVFNTGTLVTFLSINLSVLGLRRTMADAPRRSRVPLYPFTPVVGIVSCVVLAFYLSTAAILIGLAWIAVGVVAYALHRHRPPRDT